MSVSDCPSDWPSVRVGSSIISTARTLTMLMIEHYSTLFVLYCCAYLNTSLSYRPLCSLVSSYYTMRAAFVKIWQLR